MPTFGATVTDDKSWIRAYESGGQYIEHRDGVDWVDTPLPPRWHRCKPQTRGFMAGTFVQRCACGATYLMGGWVSKNETRKMRARRKAAA